MRHFFLYSLLLSAASLFAQNTNIAFRSKLTYPNQELANIWGYAAGGREYALVGAHNGLSIVDVTDADNPTEIVQIPGAGSDWHEIKTYSHYAYVVSEGGFGVQVVDLTNLPNSNLTYHSYFGNGTIGTTLTKAHALHIDETKGYLYVYGSNLFSGKALVLNLNPDPYNPTYVNYVNYTGYVHDGYVDNDLLYAANIYAGVVSVVNMTNKANPVLLGTFATPSVFPHNTWPSGSTLFTTDEKSNSFLAAYDVSNIGNITLLDKIQSNPGSNSIVHNTHILNDYAITSWYRDGVTITDVSRPANLVQVGNYDTYPNGAGNGFDGAWGVYPYLPSGNLIISNIAASGTGNGELWVLTPTYVRGCYLEGSVRNASNNQALNGVAVQLLSTSTSGTTGANGQYKIAQLQNGTFTAQFSKSGFFTQNISVTLTNGVLTPLDVLLVSTALPVELEAFHARVENRTAKLDWKTATETNNRGFEVQHSTDGATWQAAGFVAAQGNSTSTANYEFEVANLLPGIHFFRLRQMDLDGGIELSEVRSVSVRGTGLRAELLPNVVQDVCILHLQTGQPGPVEVEIFRTDGRAVNLRWSLALEEEAIDWNLSVTQLPAGDYFVVVRKEGERIALPLVKQ